MNFHYKNYIKKKHYRATDKLPAWTKLDAKLLETRIQYIQDWTGGGVVLRRAADVCGLNGMMLAARRDVTPETISRHMLGSSKMGVSDAVAYSHIMNIAPASLLLPAELWGAR